MAALTTLDDVRDEGAGDSYPKQILAACSDALVLFAAAFGGRQDAYWIAQAGLRAVCVDIDGDKLREMEAIYPDNWVFVEGDAYQYATVAAETDLVSIDCPSDQFQRCADMLPLWCELARRFVVLGTGTDNWVEAPLGWTLLERRHRSNFAGGTWWAVLRKDYR